jgi:hypothetical protein
MLHHVPPELPRGPDDADFHVMLLSLPRRSQSAVFSWNPQCRTSTFINRNRGFGHSRTLGIVGERSVPGCPETSRNMVAVPDSPLLQIDRLSKIDPEM